MTTLAHHTRPVLRSTEMLTMSEQLARARLDERSYSAREDEQWLVAMRLATAKRWDRLAAVARSRASRARSAAR